MKPWSDKNRFHQSPPSKPTIFPQASNYRNLQMFLIDVTLAVHQEQKRRQAGSHIVDDLETRLSSQAEQDETRYTNYMQSIQFDVI